MTIPQIILIFILIFILIISFKKGSDLFSPAKLFSIVWIVCIFLTEFKFSGYQHQWSLYSWFVLIVGLISFLLGVFISYVIFINKPLYNINSIREKSRNIEESKLRKLFYSIIILFILYLTSFIIEVLAEGNVPLFSPRLDRARIEFGIFGLHLIVNFQLVIMFLCIEFIILSKKKFERKTTWFMFFITMLTFGLLLQRFNYFFWGIMTLPLLFYTSRILKLRRVAIIILVFFGFLAGIQSIRLSQYVSQYVYVISKMKPEFSKDYAIFTEPYMYITMNLENMARSVDKLENPIYGFATFDWLLALSGLKHWLTDYFNIVPRPFLNSGYNTYPFYWSYFYDFGIVGIVIFPIIVGFIISSCYYMMRFTGHIKWIVLYSICVAIIIISFFTNALSMLNIIMSIFVLWFIHHFYFKQS